jgi:hypothetical protein
VQGRALRCSSTYEVPLRVTRDAGRVNCHVERDSVDCQCQAETVSNSDSSAAWDCRSPVAGIGNHDPGQVTVGMRNCHRYSPDSYMCTRMPARCPELRWHRRSVVQRRTAACGESSHRERQSYRCRARPAMQSLHNRYDAKSLCPVADHVDAIGPAAGVAAANGSNRTAPHRPKPTAKNR